MFYIPTAISILRKGSGRGPALAATLYNYIYTTLLKFHDPVIRLLVMERMRFLARFGNYSQATRLQQGARNRLYWFQQVPTIAG